MDECTVNFLDKVCCDQPVPHAGKDPAVCVSSSVDMTLLVDPVALGSVRAFVKMRANCEDNSWDLMSHNTTQICIFLSFWEVKRSLSMEAEIWETYDTEIIDDHLLHAQGFNSLPRTVMMTVLSLEMAVISPESELQLCTMTIGDY